MFSNSFGSRIATRTPVILSFALSGATPAVSEMRRRIDSRHSVMRILCVNMRRTRRQHVSNTVCSQPERRLPLLRKKDTAL